MVKNPPANTGDAGSIPESGRSGKENGNPLQYSCLGNPMDRGDGVIDLDVTEHTRKIVHKDVYTDLKGGGTKYLHKYILIINSHGKYVTGCDDRKRNVHEKTR